MEKKMAIEYATKLLEPILHAQLRLIQPPYDELQDMNLELRNFAKGKNMIHQIEDLKRLKTLDCTKLYSVHNPLGYVTILYHFSPQQQDGILVMDSFLPEPPTESFIKAVMERCGFRERTQSILSLYYADFPVINESMALQCVQNVLSACGIPIEERAIHRELLSASRSAAVLLPTIQHQLSLRQSEARSNAKKNLLHSISQGTTKHTLFLLQEYLSLEPVFSAPTVNDLRDWLIMLNAQCEYALSINCPRIHPLYLSALLLQNLTTIQNQHNIEQLQKLPAHLIEKYCALAASSQGIANCSALTASIIVYINTNIQEALCLQRIAAQFGKNESYISTLFKRETGLTVTQYIRVRKLEESAWYLRATDIPIQQAAEQVGYNDTSYFAKLFYKHYKQTPSQYRKLNRFNEQGKISSAE